MEKFDSYAAMQTQVRSIQKIVLDLIVVDHMYKDKLITSCWKELTKIRQSLMLISKDLPKKTKTEVQDV